MKKCMFFFSCGGKTQKFAEKVAKELNIQQVEKINTKYPFHLEHSGGGGGGGLLGLKSAWKQFTGWVEIKKTTNQLKDFDVIYLGTPVYMWSVAQPFQKFLLEHKDELKNKKVVLFKVSGQTTIEKVSDKYEKIVGKIPNYQFGILDKEIDDEQIFKDIMEKFPKNEEI